MFLETRRRGKQTLYYLVHSYRINNTVKRISRYLGTNLSQKDLKKLQKRAEDLLSAQLKEKHSFELTENELNAYREYGDKLRIHHLDNEFDWDTFTKEFTYNTNAIEGSTVAYGKTKKLIEKVDLPVNLDEVETINVANAVAFIRRTTEPFSLQFIQKLHLLCFTKTKPFAGKLRTVEIVVKDGAGNIIHRGAPHKKLIPLLKELISWYHQHSKKNPPLLLASIVHNQFEHIHPFQDGNGRVGRLLLNYILIHHRYPPVNIKLSDRKKYYKALRFFDVKGDTQPMMRLLLSLYKRK